MAYHYLWPDNFMLTHLVVNWFLSALALWLVARIISGIEVRNFPSALIATIVIAVVNVTLGPVLKFFGFPFIVLTLGLFLLVINAFLLKVASLFTPGFRVHGFLSAVLGSIVLTILNYLLRAVAYSV